LDRPEPLLVGMSDVIGDWPYIGVLASAQG